jgi:hypothetical protein
MYRKAYLFTVYVSLVVFNLGYAHPRGYAKTSDGVCKIGETYFVINTEQSGPDLGQGFRGFSAS